MERYAITHAGGMQVLQVPAVVHIGIEARLPVVATLHEVLGDAGQIRARLTCHQTRSVNRSRQSLALGRSLESGNTPSYRHASVALRVGKGTLECPGFHRQGSQDTDVIARCSRSVWAGER